MDAALRSANILVVDDNPYNLEILSKILQARGYQTRVANNGEAALRSLQVKIPDLVLLDIMLPDMLGYEVCRKIKQNPHAQNIPILFISALEEISDKLEGFAAGGVDYITKPFQYKEVLARVESHLSLHYLRQKLAEQNQQLIDEIQERKKIEAALQEEKRKTEEAFKQLQKAQVDLIHAEKMASLGQLIAGIAHEINSPLAALNSSTEHLKQSLQKRLPELPQFLHSLTIPQAQQFFALLEQMPKHIATQDGLLSSQETRQMRRQLTQQLYTVQVEQADVKADLLVQMNLLTLSEDLLPILQDEQGLKFLQHLYVIVDLQRNQQTIEFAVKQAQSIMRALKNYVHQDAQEARKQPTNVIESIEIVLILYKHLLHSNSIVLHKAYQSVPNIMAYPDELNQIWTNLIQNALQAMNYQGTLSIEVEQKPAPQGWNAVAVTVQDSGSGIPENLQEKIFQAFFTTKSAPEGTGLGLDIVRKIVNKHQGDISLSSQPGNTRFTIWLPVTH